MIQACKTRALLLLAAALLSGCALRDPRPEGVWLQERQGWFDTHQQWSVQGRLGLSDGERGGSLSMTWEADGDRHEIALRSVAGGRQWRLRFVPGAAELTGSEVGRLVGPDPDALVEQAVGWPIPVRWMSHWLRGLPAPDSARVTYAADGALDQLYWGQWRLDFDRWARLNDAGVLLPARLEASKPPYQVRVVLRNWKFRSPQLPTAGGDAI
ncbi:MAG: lipoprotein insertase outer membrane protein LolB [Wenzhouxiangellaceae bacterium]|nr:lipoprotein insertase outer membrane protein LolB [Wenzhouxiangellaceae bacterium]